MSSENQVTAGNPLTPPPLDTQLRFFALASVNGLGPVMLRQLLQLAEQEQITPGSAAFWPLLLNALKAVKRIAPDQLQQLEQRLDEPFKPRWPERDQLSAWLNQPGERRLLALGDADYPYLLSQIEDPPLLLYLHGNARLLHQPQLAIVGARKPTAMGGSDARAFAGALAELGWTITSGLAEGIDAAAHQGALQAAGATVAVLGTGIDRCYPARHKNLQQQIADQGLLVSEYALGTPPRGANFPRRNRIVSGLSVGLLVVEAALKSGSLISARLASEQGREVFAIPGSIHQAQNKGCHQLIKNGAKLTETVMDLHEELAHWLQPPVAFSDPAGDSVPVSVPVPARADNPAARQPELFAPSVRTEQTVKTPPRRAEQFSSAEAYQLWQAVAAGAANTDQLVLASGLDAMQVSQLCLLLEMQGLLQQQAGCWRAL